MASSINMIEKRNPVDWIKFFTLHQQANPEKGFDVNDLDMVVEMVHPEIDGKCSFDPKDALVLSRTRVMSSSESISGRDEDERWSNFLKEVQN